MFQPVLPSEAEVEAHNVSHLPFRSWCSACVRGRGLSLGHRRVVAKTKEAEQIPTISVDYGFFGQPEDRAHDTLPVLIVRDRKSKGIWSHPVPSKGVTHPYPARALMADLDFMVQESHPQVGSGAEYCRSLRRRQEWLARRSCARSLSQGREQKQWRGRACGPVCAWTCEDPQGLLGTAVRNRFGIPKPVAGLVG